MDTFQEILYAEAMREIEGVTNVGYQKYEQVTKSLIRGKNSDMVFDQKFECEKCSAKFVSRRDLNKHRQLEMEKGNS